MTERRYSREEAAAIFERAAQVDQEGHRPQVAGGEGMTLAELQEVGREVGLSSDLVARAAGALDRSGQPTGRRILGLPLQVGLNVSLGRTLSEAQWERLVVDLRTTFDARGVVRQDGNLRQWTNGNLQVLLEPEVGGHRIRFRTTNGLARTLMTAGGAMLLAGAASAGITLGAGGLGDPGALMGLGFLAVFGTSVFAGGALRLPGWAALRRRQMEEVAGRLAQGNGEG